MTPFIPATGAMVVYLVAFLLQVYQLRNESRRLTTLLQCLALCAIVLHGVAAYSLLFTEQGLDLSLSKVLAEIALVTNIIVFASGLRKPVRNLYLLLFPLAILVLIWALTGASTKYVSHLSPQIELHVLLSILAYSLLAIAAFQALLVGYQDWQLHHKHQSLLMRALPPLQTMEALLFELVWAGEILLSLSLATGFLFYQDFFAQHLLHKVVFSLIAWVCYAVLLWGRHRRGWRGKTALRLTWGAFIAILLGYAGSKFVLEILLSR